MRHQQTRLSGMEYVLPQGTPRASQVAVGDSALSRKIMGGFGSENKIKNWLDLKSQESPGSTAEGSVEIAIKRSSSLVGTARSDGCASEVKRED